MVTPTLIAYNAETTALTLRWSAASTPNVTLRPKSQAAIPFSNVSLVATPSTGVWRAMGTKPLRHLMQSV